MKRSIRLITIFSFINIIFPSICCCCGDEPVKATNHQEQQQVQQEPQVRQAQQEEAEPMPNPSSTLVQPTPPTSPLTPTVPIPDPTPVPTPPASPIGTDPLPESPRVFEIGDWLLDSKIQDPGIKSIIDSYNQELSHDNTDEKHRELLEICGTSLKQKAMEWLQKESSKHEDVWTNLDIAVKYFNPNGINLVKDLITKLQAFESFQAERQVRNNRNALARQYELYWHHESAITKDLEAKQAIKDYVNVCKSLIEEFKRGELESALQTLIDKLHQAEERSLEKVELSKFDEWKKIEKQCKGIDSYDIRGIKNDQVQARNIELARSMIDNLSKFEDLETTIKNLNIVVPEGLEEGKIADYIRKEYISIQKSQRDSNN